MNVYLYQNNTEKVLKNIYIGEYKGRLPSEYQEVEYIETTGTQFIDTGVSLTNSIQAETKIIVSTTSQNIPLFGNYVNNSSYYTSGDYYHLTPYASKWYFGKNGTEGNGGTYNATVGTEYEVIYNDSNSNLVINNSMVSSVSGTTGYSGTTLAISVRGNNYYNNKYFGQFKYCYFKVYNKSSNEYVRDLVPCYRKSDSVIGMYDLVNDQFYTNDGTGTFTKGPDVN